MHTSPCQVLLPLHIQPNLRQEGGEGGKALCARISKLQPEGVLCKHTKLLCFADIIYLKHVYCSCSTLHGIYKHVLQNAKSPPEFCPLVYMSQKGSSSEISV